MANTIVKTSLPKYVDQTSSELLIKAMTGAKTINYVETLLNVKNQTALNVLNSSVVFADGKECGFNAQGSDVLSQRILTATPIKVNKKWCDRILIDTYANHKLTLAAGRETMPFEEQFVEANLVDIANELEKFIWQGDVTLSAKGFIDLATESGSGVLTATGEDVLNTVDAVYAKLPAEVLEKGAIIFLSNTNYRAYVTALNAQCCGNQPIIDAAIGEMKYIGDSRVTIVGVGGLEGTQYVFASAKSNLVYGTDIEDAHAVFKVWFSDDDDMFRFKVLFNAGVQYKFPDEVVLGTIA